MPFETYGEFHYAKNKLRWNTSLNSQSTESDYAVIGVVPPPFGGVSVHVNRKLSLLRKNRIPATLYEQTGKSDPDRGIVPLKGSLAFVRFLLTFSESVVHFHFNNYVALAVASLVLRFRWSKKYVVTIHSEKLGRWYGERGLLFRMAMSNCFRNAEHLVCVNHNIAEFMEITLGISRDKISVIPAFLPPTEEELDPEQIPRELSEFLKDRDFVVGTHGWFGYFVNDAHVYSFDHIAKLAREIVESEKNIAIYTVISGTYDEAHRKEIESIQRELSSNWIIIDQPFSSASVYKMTDLFIRPTTTDGDSVSVRECLSLGVRVLASDAVRRPDGCDLYETRNYEELSQKFWEIADAPKQEISNVEQFGGQLVDVVTKCLKGG